MGSGKNLLTGGILRIQQICAIGIADGAVWQKEDRIGFLGPRGKFRQGEIFRALEDIVPAHLEDVLKHGVNGGVVLPGALNSLVAGVSGEAVEVLLQVQRLAASSQFSDERANLLRLHQRANVRRTGTRARPGNVIPDGGVRIHKDSHEEQG